MIKLIHQGHNSYGNNNYNAYTYNNTNWQTHFHKNLELIYALQGEILLTVNENEMTVPTGVCAMILSNQIHSFTVGNDALAWVLVFSEDFVPEFASFIKDKQGSTPIFRLEDEIDDLLRQNFILGETSMLMKKACLYAVCDQYLKQIRLEERKTKNDLLICRVLDYIETHFCEDITLESIAQEFGYEYHYLSRILNQNYNIRIKKIINEHRVDKAIQLLEDENLTMTELSMRCGFQSIRTFNEVFHSVTGQIPSQYGKNASL